MGLSNFVAYNVNAFNFLRYNLGSNIWIIGMMIATTVIILLGLKEELDIKVNEEQNVL